MKCTKLFLGLLILWSFLLNISFAQDSIRTKLAILPFQFNGIDAVSINTAESILRLEINKLSKLYLISQAKTKEVISKANYTDEEELISIGQSLEASQILKCNLAALGEKVIVQYFLYEISSGKRLLVDQVTALNVEDLETVMKRVAKSVVEQEFSKNVAEVGNIHGSESIESLRRASNKNFGISFGYLYPQNGYGSSDRVLTFEGRFDYELEHFAVGSLIAIRKGFGAYLYGSFLYSKTDLCPFIGGGLGFHWISHSVYNPGNNKEDGFELILQTGLRIFRTYNFQILINLEYNFTFNDYDDRAIIFTIGIL